MKWFYSKNISDDKIIIDGEEFRHMVSVMRVRVGEAVVVFNGEGLVCNSSVVKIDKKQVMLKVLNRTQYQPKSTRLVLAAAAIKGERQDTMLRQATELGVTDIVLLESKRSEVELSSSKEERINRTLIASCKQCHAEFIPKVTFSTLKDFTPISGVVLVGSFLATGSLLNLDGKKIKENNVTVLVGPEGGFSPEEENVFNKKGYQKVTLGQNVLRADTAAAMMLSYVKCIKEW